MANITVTSLNLNASKNEWSMSGADLLKDENLQYLEELQECGDGKGDMLRLKETEVLTFDPFEETTFIKRVVLFRGKEYPTLSIIAHSNFQQDIELPMSYFRRLPAFEEDKLKMYEGHPITERLAQASIGDFGRARILIERKSVKIDKILKLLKQTFTSVGGTSKRDDEAIVREKGETITIYQVV